MRKSPPPRLQSTGEKEEMLKNKFTQNWTFGHYLFTPLDVIYTLIGDKIFTLAAKLKAFGDFLGELIL